ncbi:hypothetical protein MmiEs2_04750 [Methanimicrococcus stummii]|uniref:Uncharacterized protein n=1 Tax=Methanimicrococcus stummii TaxID=3028294 RepID=A0AA96VHH3_9EURY|nr:hypothetical protein MmiEs2_04750 [Methanimicrococcus sp. Es2]
MGKMEKSHSTTIFKDDKKISENVIIEKLI